MAVDRWTFFGLFPFSSFFRVFLIGMMYFYIKISVDKRNILPFLIRKVHGFLGSRHVTLCFPPTSLSLAPSLLPLFFFSSSSRFFFSTAFHTTSPGLSFQKTFAKKLAGSRVCLFEIPKKYMTVWFDADLDTVNARFWAQQWLEHESP